MVSGWGGWTLQHLSPGHAAHSPVDADGAQVEDAGGAHHHIERDEDVTVEPAEKPGAADHLRTADRGH